MQDSNRLMEMLSKESPVINIQSRTFKKNLKEEDFGLLQDLVKYISNYCDFYGMTVKSIAEAHLEFLNAYTSDLKNFVATGKYPFELNEKRPAIHRLTYDIALMLSTVLTYPRFQIMKAIRETVNDDSLSKDKALIVGLGSGLELSLLKDKLRSVEAYDIELSDFCKKQYAGSSHVRLHEEKYEYEEGAPKYDAIYAIELLEHLEDPYALVEEFAASLVPGGQLIVTTAKNMPQIDHLYNFTSAEEFEGKLAAMHLSVKNKLTIPHVYKMIDVDANNVFYVFEKRISN